MIYKIDGKYYIKVGKDFTEVELVFTDNDVDLRPTNNILENNGDIKYQEINFLNEKDNLLKEHKSRKSSEESFEPKKKDFSKKLFR